MIRTLGTWTGVAAAGVLGMLALNLAADRSRSTGLRTLRNYVTGRSSQT